MVRPQVIYYGFGTIIPDVPQFSGGWQFLKEALTLPGGAVLYMHGFLSQGFASSWLGALVAVLLALGLAELAKQHFVYAGHPNPSVLHCLPAIMILLIYIRYEHPMAACLSSCAGLLFSYVWARLPLRRRPTRVAGGCLMAVLCFWLAGAGGFFVFSFVCTAYLLFLRGDGVSAVLTLCATAATIWGLAEYVFHMSPKQAFLILTPLSRDLTTSMNALSRILLLMLYAFVPVTTALMCLWRKCFDRDRALRARPRQKRRRKTDAVPRRGRAWLGLFKRIAMPLAPIALLAMGLYFGHDKIHRQIFVVNALARQQRWPEVLEAAKHLPKQIHSIYCNHDINRALYHTDRMGDDLLCFAQDPHALLLTHEAEESSMTQLRLCDTFIEMGNVDLAEKLASEFMVDKGCVGVVLEKLAWISIIKEQEQTSQVYLNALKKDLIYRHRADAMLNGLKHGFKGAEAATIRRIRSCRRRTRDGRLYIESIEEMLTGLLERNPHNKMAFEYLMSCYLLAGQLERIVANMGQLNELGYEDVPILYEEAMLLYHALRSQRLNLSELNIKRQTFERYTRFVTLCNAMQGPKRKVVLQQLFQEFGSSYFFYYRFTLPSLAQSPQG